MGGSLRPGSAVAVVLFAAGCSLPAWAEVFHFDKMPIPEPYSMSTHHVFYVHSEGDAPGRQESASVVFRNLGANLAGNSRLGSYDSVQVSLLPFDNFGDVVDTLAFCTGHGGASGKFLLKQTRAASYAATHVVPFPPAAGSPRHAEIQIKKTGRYILTYSNCGNASTASATVSGSVLVKNPYGFLPGNEYANLHFHGWCAVAYVVLNALWIGLYVRSFQSTTFIQAGIAGISAFCLLESSLSWLMYKDWNGTGSPSDFLVLLSTVCCVFKYVCAWRLLQLSSLGMGLFQDDLAAVAPARFFLSYMVFMIQQCAWKLVMNDRHAFQVQPAVVMAVALPGFFIYAAFFLWNFLALTRLLNRLKEEQQEMALACFQRVRRVLAAAAAGSCAVAAAQALDIASQEGVPWSSQFLVSGGAANLVFMMLLMAMMLLWRPSEGSWKLACAQPAAAEADEEGAGLVEGAGAAGGRPGELEGGESSSAEVMPWAEAREVKMTPSTVAPEPIGAREDEEQPKAEAESAGLL